VLRIATDLPRTRSYRFRGRQISTVNASIELPVHIHFRASASAFMRAAAPDVKLFDAFGLLDVSSPLASRPTPVLSSSRVIRRNTPSGMEYTRLRPRTRSSAMPPSHGSKKCPNLPRSSCSGSHLSPWALRVAAKSAVQPPSTTRGSAYPFGPGVTGINCGRSATGVSAGGDAAERAS
jgi:hypothetical protein